MRASLKKTRLKWTIGCLLVGLVFWISFIKIISTLPSQSQFREALKTNIDTPSSIVTQASTNAQSPGLPISLASGLPIHSSTKEKESDGKKVGWIISMVDEDPNDIRVCDNLGSTKLDLTKKNSKIDFEDIFKNDRNDSVTESLRMPIRAIFQVNEVGTLLKEIATLSQETDGKDVHEKDSLLEKVGFYSRVTLAAASVFNKKSEIEALGDRAMHLMAITKLAAIHPELKTSTLIGDYCKSIQKTEMRLTRENLKSERDELLKILSQLNIAPKDIDFDPDQWIKFNFKFDKSQLSFSLSDKDPV